MMAEFFFDYGLFLAKSVTIVVAIVAVASIIVALVSKKQADDIESFEVKKLNKKYNELASMLNASMLGKDDLKKYLKEEKKK